jgi:hypothetical protein
MIYKENKEREKYFINHIDNKYNSHALRRSPGSWGLGRLPVNYFCGLRRDTPPIKPCGHLRRIRFTSCMHDVVMKCVGSGRARVLVGTRATESVAFAPASPALAIAPRQS